MKKWYLENGTEVFEGDLLRKVQKSEHDTIIIENIINDITAAELVKEGILYEQNPREVHNSTKKKEHPKDIGYYIVTLANKLGWNPIKTAKFLDKISDIYPAASVSILLRVLALEFDKRYPDHIKNSPEIWTISTTDGEVAPVQKSRIKSWGNFAAFRSKEEAEEAKYIMKKAIEEMF